MLLGLDHLVIAVSNLEAASNNYRQLGFTVVPGGKHPVGTCNSLISFADGSYIELISFYRPNPEHRWWNALRQGGGLVDFCMQTDDLAADTAALRRAGVKIDDPVPWSRTRPDGYELKWVLSLAREEHRGVAPFLIQDETPRDERVPKETNHRNRSTGIGKLVVAVEDSATVDRWYDAVLGRPGQECEDGRLQGAGRRYEIGPHFLEILQPGKRQGPLAEWLKTRGPSPYAATLRADSAESGPLDPALTCGANLGFEA